MKSNPKSKDFSCMFTDKSTRHKSLSSIHNRNSEKSIQVVRSSIDFKKVSRSHVSWLSTENQMHYKQMMTNRKKSKDRCKYCILTDDQNNRDNFHQSPTSASELHMMNNARNLGTNITNRDDLEELYISLNKQIEQTLKNIQHTKSLNRILRNI